MKAIFAIFDRKTGSAELVKEADNVEVFERWFVSAFLRSSSLFGMYPEDFDIYEICSFDPETLYVKVIECQHPQLICSVSDLFDIFKIPRPTSAQSGE